MEGVGGIPGNRLIIFFQDYEFSVILQWIFMEIIDSHTHWGPSVTMGTEVTTEELLRQAEQSGVSRVVIFPFPSTALADQGINQRLLDETNRIKKFIPYYYIPETMKPIPEGKGFYGGKWHWMRGVQDCSSNYQALKDPKLREFIDASERIDLPIVLEEEFAFTEAFVKKTKSLKVIIPHLGGLGGNPMDFLDPFKGRENVYFDTALASSDKVMKFIYEIGHERILFGSDVPFGTMKWELEKILSLRIGDDKKEWIFSKNLKRLTGLT
jgi:predicted TIM-barrel fold metal-dependent hydrolase